ncbi:hypothetical protein V8E36_008176 [Tilletia maclaganii]
MPAPDEITVVARIRRVSVRFTDASIADFDAELRGKPAIIEENDEGDGQWSESQQRAALFDVREEVGGDRRHLPVEEDEELLRLLAEDEDNVRTFKQKIRAARPSLAHRRLRLIHAGRILKDGIKLVSWLDSLDAHRSAQERAANRSAGGLNLGLGEGARAALGGLRDAADLDSLARRGRQGLGDLLRRFDDDEDGREGGHAADDLEASRAPGSALSAKAKGKARLIDDEEQISGSASEWGSAVPQPRRRGFKLIEDRSAERVYIQCSIGDDMTAEEEAEANAPRALAPPPALRGRPNPWESTATAGRGGTGASTPAQLLPPSASATIDSPWADLNEDPFGQPGWSDQDEAHASSAGIGEDGAEPIDAPRGFDRLAATAGLSTVEIEEMRAQFRLAAARGWGAGGIGGAGGGGSGPSGLGRSGDVLREADEEEHARALEEQWIDSMGEGLEGDANRGNSGLLQARFEGLFVGFFFPFLPLFFWRDKTGHPSRLPRSEFVYDPQRPGEVIRADEMDYDSEDDDDIVGRGAGASANNGSANANLDARNIVFTSTMAQAIIVGLVCNFAYGALASLW